MFAQGFTIFGIASLENGLVATNIGIYVKKKFLYKFHFIRFDKNLAYFFFIFCYCRYPSRFMLAILKVMLLLGRQSSYLTSVETSHLEFLQGKLSKI